MTGLRYLGDHPLARPLSRQIGISNFFLNVVGGLIAVYAIRDLGLTYREGRMRAFE